MKRTLVVAGLVAVLMLGLAAGAMAAQTAPDGAVGKKKAGARLEKARERISKAIERAEQVKERALERGIYGQYLTMKEEIDEAIQEVIRSTQFIKSGKVLEFEHQLSEYLHTHVVTCGNGTDALQIAFMALGLQPGDEVITSPFTFIATVEVLALLGLKPVFADVQPGTFNLDATEVEKVITNKTKAILPVHLFGQCAQLEPLLHLAKKYNLYLVEDACQALGTDYI